MQTQANGVRIIMKARKRKKHLACKLLITLLSFAVILYSASFVGTMWKERFRPGSQAPMPAAAGLDLHSANALLLRLDDTRQILLERQAAEQIYPASMSKVMTAVVVLEQLDSPGERVTLGEGMYAGIYEANATTAGYLPGEEVPAIDLLYGLLLPSGAECAIGLAEHVAGTEDAFVDLMNQRAAELGRNDTHFANPTGLHDPNHYTTLCDLAVLLEHALGDDVFYRAFTSSRYSGSPTNLHPDGITVHSSMFSRMESAEMENGVLLGGKTGYTDEAGQCLASLAEIGGDRYLLITSGAPGERHTQTLHIDDAFAVYSQLAGRTFLYDEKTMLEENTR